jgi:hypothetical protein
MAIATTGTTAKYKKRLPNAIFLLLSYLLFRQMRDILLSAARDDGIF